jgi:glyoxylase-like metal-dependent hydrolase (beta-lactamase superfamily II)
MDPKPPGTSSFDEVALVIETYDDIGITRLSRWIFNCYLIHDGGSGDPLIVDPGLPCIVGDLPPLMERLGLSLESLTALCVTHAHSDHVAGAPALAAQSEALVYLPERSQLYLSGGNPRSPRPSAIARIWPTAFDQPFDARGVSDAIRGSRIAGYGTGAEMRWPDLLAVGYLSDGQPLPGAPDWIAISTPGHTDDSTSFWHPDTQTLLSGDAVLSVDGRAWVTPETVDDDASAKSSKRLRELEVAHLLPGHGLPVHGAGLTASALGPQDGPKGMAELTSRGLRCVTGRR